MWFELCGHGCDVNIARILLLDVCVLLSKNMKERKETKAKHQHIK